MAVREAEPLSSLHEVREAGLDREDLLQIYRNLLITRGIEERGHILYKQGKIPGSFCSVDTSTSSLPVRQLSTTRRSARKWPPNERAGR